MELIWHSIKNSTTSLFRFEGLQDYSGEDGMETVRAFIDTGVLIEHPRDTLWWREMKVRNEQDITTQRVRLVTEPLTDYTKWELAYLKEAKEYSGDDIRIITEKEFFKITSEEIPDFWLIDNEYVFLMHYGKSGKYLHSEQVTNIDKYLTLKTELMEASVPL